MTINISFSNKTVRVAVELNGGIESAITELPPRQWAGMTHEDKERFVVAYYPSNWDRKTAVALMDNYESYLKEKST